MLHWTFYIETYGCRVNQNESQMLREAWARLGGIECSNPEQADYILINSCAITARAERDARNAVYRHKRMARQAKVMLTGCAAQLFTEFKPRKNAHWENADFCIPQSSKAQLLAGPAAWPNFKPLTPLFANITTFDRSRPIIKIQDGCSCKCSYCIVPSTRGMPVSRPASDILKECRGLLEAGFGELVISGINLNQYRDEKIGDFWALLQLLDREFASEFSRKARFRISSIWPGQLSPRGIEIYSNLEMVCPHLHLSLQHAAPDILESMGRSKYQPEKLLPTMQELRKEKPVFGLGADIIVGYPGESEADFNTLKSFLAELGLTYAHIFPFSARPGTKAAALPNQIAKKIKLARARELRSQIEKQKQQFLALQTQLPLLKVAPEHNKDGLHKGINEFYASCEFTTPVEEKNLILAKPVKVVDSRLIVEKIK